MLRRHLTSTAAKLAVTAAVFSVLLAGCAGMDSLTADVASFGEWPAGRSAGSYAFERLPSQQARPELAEALEASARGALAKAGFKPAAAGEAPDFLVQLGTRVSRSDPSPWADPIWWRGGFGYWRAGPWLGPWYGPYGPGWALYSRPDLRRYEREVALLIRDRASGKPLFEARASHDGPTRGDQATVAAMFEAALVDFPRLGINPRQVTVALPN
jgi:hypothetical protein